MHIIGAIIVAVTNVTPSVLFQIIKFEKPSYLNYNNPARKIKREPVWMTIQLLMY